MGHLEAGEGAEDVRHLAHGGVRGHTAHVDGAARRVPLLPLHQRRRPSCPLAYGLLLQALYLQLSRGSSYDFLLKK